MEDIEKLNQMQQKVDSYHYIMYALDELLWKLKDKELNEVVNTFKFELEKEFAEKVEQYDDYLWQVQEENLSKEEG